MKYANRHIKILIKKITGTANSADELKYSRLSGLNEDLLEEYNLLQKLWNESGKIELFTKIDTGADWSKLNNKYCIRLSGKHVKIGFTGYLMRIAAVLVIASGIALVLYKSFLNKNADSTGRFIAVSSESKIRDVILPDGSNVTLNKNSTLTFGNEFGKSSRDVILEGEAYFSVQHNAGLPFRVYIDESVIEVTGTSFTICKENDGKLRVAVLTGTVLLSSANNSSNKVSITANQSACTLNDEEIIVEEKIPVNNLSWKTGRLTFDETPIDSALLDIAQYFNRELKLHTSIEERITAEFRNQPLNEILDEFELVSDLKFDTTGTLLIVSK